MSEIIVRPYEAGDETGIISLFNEVFAQKIDLEYWRWKYAENSAGFPLIGVAVAGSLIVGHRSYIPARFILEGKDIRVTQSVDMMVHPNYRKKGILRQLSYLTKRQMEEAGDIAFNFTFPMPHVEALVKHLTGFKSAFPVPSLAKVRNPVYLLKRPLSHLPALQRKCRLLGIGMMKHRPTPERFQRSEPSNDSRVQTIQKFDWRADHLWGIASSRHAVSRIRDARYLNWRYAPSRYQKLALFDGDRLMGFVVVTVNTWNGWTVGNIVDILAIDSHLMRELLDAALDRLGKQDADVFRCWISLGSIAKQVLVKLGFRSRPPSGNILVGVYDQDIDDDILLNAEHWYLTHGDVDAV